MPPVDRTRAGRHPRSAVVVGAGVAGLVAAWRLRRHGVAVTIVEASGQIGGQVRTAPFAGRLVELGAEGLCVATPWTRALLDELDLTSSAVAAVPGPVWVQTRRGLRRLPAGVGASGPARLGPVLRSRVLSPRGIARAALQPWYARHQGPVGDVAVADYVAARYGRQVADRLVDPLLGDLHGGDIHRLSLQACDGQPLRTSSDDGTAVVTWAHGLQTLVRALDAAGGAAVRLGTIAAAVHRGPDDEARYVVRLANGDALMSEAVVLAVPLNAAAALLRDLAPAVARLLEPTATSSVATVVASIPRATAARSPALRSTGVLLPSSSPHTLRSATFLTAKWPHLADADTFLVRLSAGRAGSPVADALNDDELVVAVFDDLSDVTGSPLAPLRVLVHRWPDALPQLEVGHAGRIRTARALLRELPGVVLAGAGVDGVGVAAAMRSGEVAAEELTGQAAPTRLSSDGDSGSVPAQRGGRKPLRLSGKRTARSAPGR